MKIEGGVVGLHLAYISPLHSNPLNCQHFTKLVPLLV